MSSSNLTSFLHTTRPTHLSRDTPDESTVPGLVTGSGRFRPSSRFCVPVDRKADRMSERNTDQVWTSSSEGTPSPHRTAESFSLRPCLHGVGDDARDVSCGEGGRASDGPRRDGAGGALSDV